jgi:hypothetical protein
MGTGGRHPQQGFDHAVVLIGIGFGIENADEVPIVQQVSEFARSVTHLIMITLGRGGT